MATLSEIITPTNVLTATSTNTVTNKTISGASNTLSNISLGTSVTGTLPVANGGTGTTSLTANSVILGNGTSAVQTVAPGTSGNVLTSNGTAWVSQAASTPVTGIGADFLVKDYKLTLPRTIGTGTGTPAVQTFKITETLELFLIGSNSALVATVWDNATEAFYPPVLVRVEDFVSIIAFTALAISESSVLVCSLPPNSTALSTVVLSISGGSITVNSAVNTTLATFSTLFNSGTRLEAAGTSYVLAYQNGSNFQPRFRAITVSGTVPTVGPQFTYDFGGNNNHFYVHNSSTVVLITASSTSLFILPVSVSGTTLTAGTAAFITISSFNICSGVLSTGRIAIAYPTNSNVLCSCAVVTITGTTATASIAGTTISSATASPTMQIFDNQAFVLSGPSASDRLAILTDTGGVASVGTSLLTGQRRLVGFLSGKRVLLASNAVQNSSYIVCSFDASNTVQQDAVFANANMTTALILGGATGGGYTQPLAGPASSKNGIVGVNTGTRTLTLRTPTGKTASMQSISQPFVFSVDGEYPAKLQQTPNPLFTQNSISDSLSADTGWYAPELISANATTVILTRIKLV